MTAWCPLCGGIGNPDDECAPIDFKPQGIMTAAALRAAAGTPTRDTTEEGASERDR